MKKKIVALAVAAAFTTPAFADNANVTVYGKAFLNVESANSDKVATATTGKSVTRVNTNASRFGVKGSEDLGEGLKGLYQFEVQVDADGNSGNGFGNGTRNSGVGIEGGFGKVIIGIWDTPFKVAHNKIELFDNTTSFTSLNLIGHYNGAANNYNTRQKNDVQYWSPTFNGFQAALSYSPDEAPTTTTNKSLLSMSGTFEQEDIYVSAAYESRADVTTAGKTDTAMRLVGKYNLADLWLGVTVESLKISAATAYTQSNMELAGQYKMGPHKLAASFAKAGKTNVAATGATQLSLRYGFDFSKRTEAFAAYTSLKNDSAGTYGFYGTTAGSTQSVLGAGVVHSF
jgi:predicted porin